MAKRKHIGVHIKSEVLALSDYKCFYCGAPFTQENPPTMDHVVSVHKGGKNQVSNLVAACQKCNTTKGSLPLGAMYRERKDFEAKMRAYLGLSKFEIRALRLLRKIKNTISRHT